VFRGGKGWLVESVIEDEREKRISIIRREHGVGDVDTGWKEEERSRLLWVRTW